MSKSFGFIFLVTTSLALSACTFSLAGDVTPPPGSELPYVQETSQMVPSNVLYPILPPDLVSGAKIYSQNCTQCHGTRGLGDGPQAAQLPVPPAALGFSDFATQYTPAEWYTIVTQGMMEKYMPDFANLTDRQRWDVVSYAMSLSTPPDMVHQGQMLYQQNCVSCHGQSGKGNGPEAAGLSAKPADFTNQAFMAQVSSATLNQVITSGIAPDMPAYAETLDDNARQAIVAYLRSLTYANPPPSTVAYPAPRENNTAAEGTAPYPAPRLSPTPAPTPTALMVNTSPGTGSVTIQLVNGSGGEVPSDAKVTLYGFDDLQNTYSDTLTSGVEGVYTFTNVSMPEGRAFLALAEYAGGTYSSAEAVADPSTPNLTLQTTIYDPTTDISVLTTDRVHILLDFSDPKNVYVVEVFIISNPSNQAIVPLRKYGPVVTFPLPAGYSNLQFQQGALGGRYVEVSQGFADTLTVNPGIREYQVIFAFQMPYNQKLSFSQPMFLPTSAIIVMVPENGVKVTSSMLQDSGTRDFQDTTYRVYDGSSLIAGSTLEFTLSGTPKKASSSILSIGNAHNLEIGLGVFGIALAFGGLWFYRKNQQNATQRGAPYAKDIASLVTEAEPCEETENNLMDAIIALDDQYHAGNLPKDAYLKRRAVLKDKLSRMVQD
jgi:mono/diheme cytochrome c family protein